MTKLKVTGDLGAFFVRLIPASFLFYILPAISLAACGGGGGASSSGGGGGPIIPLPSPPPTAVSGDVRILPAYEGITGYEIGYDSDQHLPVLEAPANPSGIMHPGGFAYSTKSHQMFFTAGTALYRNTPATGTTTVTTALSGPRALALDGNDTAYIIDNDRVVSVSINGTVKQLTPAGSVPIPTIGIAMPHIAYSAADGNLYITDPANQEIKQVTPSGSITVVAGACIQNVPADGGCAAGHVTGAGSASRLNGPSGIAYDPINGLLYFTATDDNEIWSMTTSGTTAVVAGYGIPGNLDGNGSASFLYAPTQLVYESDTQKLLFLEAYVPGYRVLGTFAATGSPAPAFTPNAAWYPLPSIAGNPGGGALATDNTLWFKKILIDKMEHVDNNGNVAEYALPPNVRFFGPDNVVIDKRGFIWSTASIGSPVPTGFGLLRMDSSGASTYIPLQQGFIPFAFSALALGPDGNAWFGDSDILHSANIGYVDANLTVHQFVEATGFNVPRYNALATGSDGYLWFFQQNVVGKFDVNGQLAWTGPFPNQPTYTTANPVDGNIWWTDSGHYAGKVTPSGAVSAFDELPGCLGCFTGAMQISPAPDGSAWLAEGNYHVASRVDGNGKFSHFYMPVYAAGIWGVVPRTDGKVWVIGRYGVFLLDPDAYAKTPFLNNLFLTPKPSLKRSPGQH